MICVVGLAAFGFRRWRSSTREPSLITRSLMETLEVVEGLDPKVYGVLAIDSITHLWEAARAAYNGKMLPNGGIPILRQPEAELRQRLSAYNPRP